MMDGGPHPEEKSGHWPWGDGSHPEENYEWEKG